MAASVARFPGKARHCGLRCASLLTDCTPGTPRVTASAFWICASECTYCDNCTTPRYVATLIGKDVDLHPLMNTNAGSANAAAISNRIFDVWRVSHVGYDILIRA
jgi:hypothetical protein